MNYFKIKICKFYHILDILFIYLFIMIIFKKFIPSMNRYKYNKLFFILIKKYIYIYQK